MPLTQEQFRNGVQNLDGQFIPFDQNDFVDRRAFQDNGACGAFAAVWIRNKKLQAEGQAAPSREVSLEEVSWLCEQRFKGDGDVYKTFLEANGLKRDGAIAWSRPNIDWEKLWFFVKAQPAYYLIGVVGPDDGHGIAINTTGGRNWLFDPNYGVAKFDSEQKLKKFFCAYWPRAYPDLKVGRGIVERYR